MQSLAMCHQVEFEPRAYSPDVSVDAVVAIEWLFDHGHRSHRSVPITHDIPHFSLYSNGKCLHNAIYCIG